MPFVHADGGNLIVADVSDSRLDFARKHASVTRTIDARQDVLQQLKDHTNNDLPTVVIDATGNAASMMKTFDLIAPGGRIVFVGLFQGDVTFNDPNFHRREITLLAARNATAGDFRRIIGMMESNQIDPRPWITHRASAIELTERISDWLDPDAGVIKAMVEF
jgi:threonine dehydrogenase-like Zn-dependent dehydrogenase